jgi:hypothetical protein
VIGPSERRGGRHRVIMDSWTATLRMNGPTWRGFNFFSRTSCHRVPSAICVLVHKPNGLFPNHPSSYLSSTHRRQPICCRRADQYGRGGSASSG